MKKVTFHFPKIFLWGTATSSHQVEGNNTNNNWYAWENTPGKIHGGAKAGLACDWWSGRWKEDLKNAANDGQNAHRLSIEWSRIEPEPGKWDQEALNYYREMLKGMQTMGLTPMLTLHHFTDPLWISEQGGWENDETPRHFAKFVRKSVEALKEHVNLWVTINEPAVYTVSGYLMGIFPPGKNDLGLAFQVMRNLIRGHIYAYDIIHELQPGALVGIAKNYRPMALARPWFPPDRWITNFTSGNFNNAFNYTLLNGNFNFVLQEASLPEAIGTQDFIGVNYYSRDLIAFKPLAFKGVFHRRFYPENAELSENGFIANIPIGMFESLQWASRFKLPIYITENGIEDSQDALRPRYLVEHIQQVWRGIDAGWDIRGYFHWSQVDNFEWERAWTQRFGLWGLNVDTQKRIRRKSVDIYAAICKQNGISHETVNKYIPELYDKLFPT